MIRRKGGHRRGARLTTKQQLALAWMRRARRHPNDPKTVRRCLLVWVALTYYGGRARRDN